MDHAREVELILTMDRDVQRLLDHCNALMSAGDDRPLLTRVGRQLRDQLLGVAAISGSLAALVADGGEEPRDRRKIAAGADTTPSRSPRESAAPATPTSAPVVRLKPRMPRGAWRSRGFDVASHRRIASSEDADGGSRSDATEESANVPAHASVYRLRKAGTTEPDPAAAHGHDDRNALDRLRDFFGEAKCEGQTTA